MYMTVPGSGKASVLFLNKVDDHQRVLHRRLARSELHFNRVVLCVVTQVSCDGVRWGEERGGFSQASRREGTGLYRDGSSCRGDVLRFWMFRR